MASPRTEERKIDDIPSGGIFYDDGSAMVETVEVCENTGLDENLE